MLGPKARTSYKSRDHDFPRLPELHNTNPFIVITVCAFHYFLRVINHDVTGPDEATIEPIVYASDAEQTHRQQHAGVGGCYHRVT